MADSADVGVVGAGPAGARAAELLARQGEAVVLLDHRVPWEKPCGGGLTAPLFREVPELEEIKPAASRATRARVELGRDGGFEIPFEEPIWIISRERLGRWLLERAVAAGAVHVRARAKRIRRVADGWLLETDSGVLRVASLIGADGAASTVRSSVAPELAVALMPTRVAYPREGAPVADGLVIRFYDDLVGYLWDFPRPDHHSIGIEATGHSWRRPELDARIDAFGESVGWSQDGVARAGAVIGTSFRGHADFRGIAGSGFALLGDAAGLADPFTGEGIRNALRSAELLSAAWGSGRAWSRTYIALAHEAFGRELAFARLLRRTLSESGLGVRLVGWATRSDLSYAIATATLRTVSVHDPRRFLARLREAFQEVRADPRRRLGSASVG